jgi:hypothetical protein
MVENMPQKKLREIFAAIAWSTMINVTQSNEVDGLLPRLIPKSKSFPGPMFAPFRIVPAKLLIDFVLAKAQEDF